MNYRETWDLSTIPDKEFRSEIGRRTSVLRGIAFPRGTNVKLKPCKHCGELLTARERRKVCKHCGERQSK